MPPKPIRLDTLRQDLEDVDAGALTAQNIGLRTIGEWRRRHGLRALSTDQAGETFGLRGGRFVIVVLGDVVNAAAV